MGREIKKEKSVDAVECVAAVVNQRWPQRVPLPRARRQPGTTTRRVTLVFFLFFSQFLAVHILAVEKKKMYVRRGLPLIQLAP